MRYTSRLLDRSAPDSIPSRSFANSRGEKAFPPDLQHPDFPTLCAHLNEHGVRYLVMGGWAAIAHGLPRSTLDVDLFAEPSLANLEKLVSALSKVGFGIAKELDASEILKRRIFLFSDQIRVDIFVRPVRLDTFENCWNRRLEKRFEMTTIPFLGADDLLRSKETGREQDEKDIEALRELWKDKGP